ncbi:hypothetical protein B0J12DRAFT_443643 [Macrophomina phaseolina]|uniref:Dienelactone hydrolase domain-containing protein n=1 Tax=Macrophomina phaseolina TaxID=35725 RepID=A0ABQ8FQS6_9PEZI|nr:hypothetical protein B0J12DRAFT_443643 [Macrophomina phaseolina]
MKYLQDPFYNTAPPTAVKGPTLDKDFTDQVYKDIPPPSSGPSPMGPNGPDFTNYRVAWMFRNLREGTLMQTIVADGNFDRVDPASLFSTGSFPPTYFIHGTADALVDHKFSGRAHQELKARGVETELVLVPDAPHGFDARAQPGDENFAVVAKGFEFLRAHV